MIFTRSLLSDNTNAILRIQINSEVEDPIWDFVQWITTDWILIGHNLSDKTTAHDVFKASTSCTGFYCKNN